MINTFYKKCTMLLMSLCIIVQVLIGQQISSTELSAEAPTHYMFTNAEGKVSCTDDEHFMLEAIRNMPPNVQPHNSFTRRVPASLNNSQQNNGPEGVTSATFDVTYTGFSPQAQTAFQYAVNLWASGLSSSQTIRVSATMESFANPDGSANMNTIGSAGAKTLIGLSQNSVTTLYPVALAEALLNQDLNTGDFEIVARFNSNFVFYYGTDGNTPAGQMNFVSIVLHELGHGLGFAGSAKPCTAGSNQGCIGLTTSTNNTYNTRFDVFTVNNNNNLTNTAIFPNTSTALYSAITSNNLYWAGSNAYAANTNTNPKIYAPTSWATGSSYSHFDEIYYSAGNPNSLMTPQISYAESVHILGPVGCGLMRDLGWTISGTLCNSVASCVATAPAAPSVSAITSTTATVNWTAVTGAVSYRIEYKQNAATTWTTVNTTALTTNLTGLSFATLHNVRVYSLCDATTISAASTVVNFTTSPCVATAPAAPSVSAITSVTATVSWAAVTGAVSYRVEYKQNAATTWTTVNTTALTTNLTGLSFATLHNVRVYSVCDATTSSAASAATNFTTLASPCANANSCRCNDSLQLVSLYNATDGANWYWKWDLSQPMTNWYGVTLNPEGCVKEMDLSHKGLNGIFPNIALSQLQLLRISFNAHLRGIASLSLMPNLQRLEVGFNDRLTGNLPNLNLPNLQYLEVSFNSLLNGNIPQLNLPELKHLDLSFNKLSGNIPNLNLPKLTYLDLGYNQLSGCLPPELRNLCTHVTEGRIWGNPNLGTQYWDDFCANSTGMCVTCTAITASVTGKTSICGTGPTTLTVITNAGAPTYLWSTGATTASIDVATANTYSVTVTQSDGCMKTASAIVTSDNSCRCNDSLQLVSLYNATAGANWTNKWNLSQPITTWYGVTLNATGCVTCIDLDGALDCTSNSTSTGNNLVGTIPANLDNLKSLTSLSLNDNGLISGSIPNFTLPNLQHLLLRNNQLSGTIPNLNLPNLKILELSSNQLNGTIPNFNTPNLEWLLLASNQLNGMIPNFNMPKLDHFFLQLNKLSGTIPNFNMPVLRVLNFSTNQLTGTIPNFNMANLAILELAGNQLTGSIPNFSSRSLWVLRLSSNLLSGCIPQGIRTNCPQITATWGDISNNPSLATQNWANYWNNGEGACCPTAVTATLTPIQKCSGTSLSLTTNTIVGSSYSWTNTAGTVVSTQRNPTIAASSTTANSGTYTCSIKDANGCVTNTIIQQVTINSSPVFQLPGIGQEIFHLCNGNSFTFPFQAVNTGTGTAPITYAYTSPTATTLPYPNSIASVNNSHAGRYYLVATDANGCKGSIDVTLAVWDNPTIYTITNTGNQCASTTGTAITLSGSDAAVPNVSQTLYILMKDGVEVVDALGNRIGTFGTGASISFPAQTAIGVYEVMAIRTLLQTQGSLCSKKMQGSVNITPIPTPATPSVSSITTMSATVSWVAVSCAVTYKVEYKTAAATTWTTLPNTANATANLTGLTAGTAYNVRVTANGVGVSSTPSVIANFTTITGVLNTVYRLAPTTIKCSDQIINLPILLGQAVQNINEGYAININYNSNQLELVDASKGSIVPADATLLKTLAAGSDVFGIALSTNNISGAINDTLLKLQFRLKPAAAVANTTIVVSAQIVEAKLGIERVFDASTTYTVTGSSAAKIALYNGVVPLTGATTVQWTGTNPTQTATLTTGQTILNNTGNTTLSISRQVNIPVGSPVIGGQDAFKAWNIVSNYALYRPTADEIIAADVNGSGTVTIADVTSILRRGIGVLPTGFPQPSGANKDWRFYPKSLVTTPAFTISATYPLCDGVGYCKTNVPIIADSYPLQITSTNCDTVTKDWNSVLIGNVTGTTGSFFRDPSVLASLRGAPPTVKFMLTDSVRTAEGLFIPMIITDIERITALDIAFTSPSIIIQDLTDTLMFRSVSMGSNVVISAFALGEVGIPSGVKIGYLKAQTTASRKLNATDFGTVVANVNGDITNARIEFTSAILAVTLTKFEAHPLSKNVELTWSTSSEQQNDHFEVQRSTDGKTFSKIGSIKGHGTTVEPHTYQFLDESPLNSINYYRLKQVDADGQSEYSKTVSVDMLYSDKNIRIYPNPVKDKVIIETNSADDYTIELFDIAGKLLQSHKTNQLSLQLSTSDLPSGMYMISVTSQIVQKTFKIVKQ